MRDNSYVIYIVGFVYNIKLPSKIHWDCFQYFVPCCAVIKWILTKQITNPKTSLRHHGIHKARKRCILFDHYLAKIIFLGSKNLTNKSQENTEAAASSVLLKKHGKRNNMIQRLFASISLAGTRRCSVPFVSVFRSRRS